LSPPVANPLTARMHKGINTTLDEGQTLIANGGAFDVAHALRGEGFDASEDGTGHGTPLVPVAFDSKGIEVQFATDGSHPTLRSMGHNNSHQNAGGHAAVAFDLNQITSKTNRSQPDPMVHHTLPATSTPPHLALPWAVRRLTPIECERLQAFPDSFTRIPYRKKPAESCPDGPRYKALGNSWAVNCAEWVGERIAEVDTWT
jgi:DNA (cytosine-5)-methyltransferase 1